MHRNNKTRLFSKNSPRENSAKPNSLRGETEVSEVKCPRQDLNLFLRLFLFVRNWCSLCLPICQYTPQPLQLQALSFI